MDDRASVDLENLTLGTTLRLEDLVARDALGELVRSFHDLFGIPIRVLSSEGQLLADASVEQELCRWVNGFGGGARACALTVVGAKRAEPGGVGATTHPCFTGAEYRIVAIEYDARRLGRAVLGPFVPDETAAPPESLLSIDAGIDRAEAAALVAKMPRASKSTIDRMAEHLRSTLDLILFAGHKALLTSHMHLATVRESYRELQDKNQKLQEAFDRLKELDRLKSNFLGTVSHELRTPLTSIIGYSEMLGEGIAGSLTDEQREFVETIHEKGEQLLGLISSLLDMSKLESGTMTLRRTIIDVAPVLGDVAATLAPVARKRAITLEHVVDAGVPPLRADGERLRQVLLNLVDNAIKFSPEGSRVSLRASVRAPRHGNAPDEGFVLLEPSRQEIEIRVADQGIGIAEEQRQRVFDAFYQIDSSSTREYGGSGLGLSIVKRLVEAHGGSVGIESNEPAGTVFVISLPVEP